MNKKMILVVMFSFLFVPGISRAAEGWSINGKEVMEDEENVKTKDGFGAQLWVIKQRDFFEKWNTPETPKMNPIKSIKRNVPFSTVVLFINPGVNEKNECDVVCDMVIKTPDGKEYANMKDVEVWQKKPPAPRNNIQLAAQNVGIMIEDKDPLGKYTVDAVVKDRIRGVALSLHQVFEAEE